MGNVLSQKEIDELLNSLKSGNIDKDEENKTGQKIKSYDFRLANKFSKEQLRSINNIFENYTRLLTNYFTGTLRTSCEIELISIEELKYGEFTNSLPNVCLFGIIGLAPLLGSSLISISTRIAYVLINRVLGGSVREEEPELNFTEIELVIMERILRQLLHLLDEAWNKVVEVDSSLERIETNPQYAQIVSLNEPIAIITMNVKVSNIEGFIHICIPHLAIKPIEKLLTVKSIYHITDESSNPVMSNEIKKSVNSTSLKLIAKLNDTNCNVNDLINLQEGDVLVIDHKASEPVNLYIEQLPKFKGKLGVKGNNYSVLITEIDSREDNINERDSISG